MNVEDFGESLKSEVSIKPATIVEMVSGVEYSEAEIQRLQEKYPKLGDMQDAIRKLKTNTELCLVFEGRIRNGDEECPFVNFVRRGKNFKDIRNAVNIIFLPGREMQTYRIDQNEKMGNSRRYSKRLLDESHYITIFDNGDIEKRDNVTYEKDIDGNMRTIWSDITIQNYIRGFSDFDFLDSKAGEKYPDGVIITSGVQWEDETYEDARHREYGLLYPTREETLPVKIYDIVDDIRTVWELGTDGKYTIVHNDEVGHGGEGLPLSENGKSTTLEEYIKLMQEKYGVKPVTSSNVDMTFSDPLEYSIPEEIKEIVEACYRSRIQQLEQGNGEVAK